MAERLTIPKDVINSFHKDQAQWEVAIAGIKLAAIGVALAGGVTLILLAPATATYLPSWMVGGMIVIGAFCSICGTGLWLIGLGKCLIVPHQNSRLILLAGMILSIYGMSDAMNKMFYVRPISDFGSKRINPSGSEMWFEQLGANYPTTVVPSAVYSLAASILISVFLLSLGTYIRSQAVSKKIHELWIVQFGGAVVVAILSFVIAYLVPMIMDMSSIAVVLTLALAITQVAFTIYMLFQAFNLTASELEKVTQHVKQIATAAKKKG